MLFATRSHFLRAQDVHVLCASCKLLWKKVIRNNLQRCFYNTFQAFCACVTLIHCGMYNIIILVNSFFSIRTVTWPKRHSLFGKNELKADILAYCAKVRLKNSFSKYEQTCSFKRICWHLLKKSLMENFISSVVADLCIFWWW